jgi:MerR family transcriptional regulator, thiopeptide resistance regulator
MRIQEVARASGVTSRTLRHYDAIGLLRPRQTGPNGLRLYGDAELVRLQRILVLRELGLPLDRIAEVLDGSTDDATALRAHVAQLRRQRARIDRIITAVEGTIAGLEQGDPMQDTQMFDGFADDPYAEEAQERWPDQYAESQRRLRRMTKDEQAALFERGREVTRQLGAQFTAGAAVDDPAVQALVGQQYDWVGTFWTPNREAYVGLGRMYVDDPRFTATYDAVAPGLAVFLRDAIAVWAPAHLTD